MSDPRSQASAENRVQIVGPADNWILERLARKLAAKLPYCEFVPWKPQPRAATHIAYYVNYALYEAPSGLIDVGYFTHVDQEHQFLERARQIDFCISQSHMYADWLKSHGVDHVVHIPMGFDSVRYRPRLVLGVVGLLDHPRKGKELVDHLRQLPFVQILTTEGRVPENQMRDFYARVDYVLIPATVEGGPMSLLEALGMGKPVIAPEGVGMVQEFPECNSIRRYPKGDAGALERLVRTCFHEKLECSNLVNGRSWDDWAEGHHHLFMTLLKSRGIRTPTAAPGFRFGMMSELDLPWDIDLEPLETAVDRAAAHLFFGRYSDARDVLSDASIAYPCVKTLLDSIPERDEMPSRRGECLSAVPMKMETAQRRPRRGEMQATRPPEDAAELLDARTRGFVPRSEVDHQPRILLIAHVGTLRDRMDKSHFYRYEALSRRPGVKLFGPGLPGYRYGMSVDEAVQRTFWRSRPDLIIHGGDLRDSGIPLVTGLDQTDLVTAIELLDTWANPDRTIDFIKQNRFDIGLMQEAGSHIEFFRQTCPQTEFFWTPNGVDTSRFRDYGLPKEFDVILYGVVEPRIYPFRTRLFELLANTPDLRVNHIKHPGYYTGQEQGESRVGCAHQPENRVCGAYQSGGKETAFEPIFQDGGHRPPYGRTSAAPVVSGSDLARAINQCWIGIATRSAYNCLLMKYLEIAASGAAIAGNVPDSGRELFKDCMIELHEEMSDETILATLRAHLADKDRLQTMIAVATQRVARDFSTEAFADRVMGGELIQFLSRPCR